MTAVVHKGFTLLEMLVTLVMVSLIGLILSQAMFQIGKVEQLLEEEHLRSMDVSLRAIWVHDALTALLPGQVATHERFGGGASSLHGVSTAVPQFPNAGVGFVSFSLKFNAELGRTELLLVDEEAAEGRTTLKEGRTPTVLLSWPGPQGRFQYQDVAGRWHDRWPPPLSSSPALPAMIILETGMPELPQLLAAPRAVDVSLPTRSALEKM